MNASILLVIYFALFIHINSANHNNVCKHLRDYKTKLINKNCWYNSDADLNVPGVIKKYGYPVEEYDVITKDGYILSLFRIPYGRNGNQSDIKSRQPVFLQHGILASSAPWVINGNESIGFMLADRGYDVWLGNSRGSTYGKGHTKFSLNDAQYWNFSYHEMGIYDLPSSFDVVSNITGRSDIICVGQSMGTNLQYVYASEMPEHAEKRLKVLVSLGPTLFLKHVKTPLRVFAIFWPLIQVINKYLKIREIFPNSIFLTTLTKAICLPSGMQILFCETAVFLTMGFDYEQLPPATFPVILGHYPGGSSFNTLLQLAQGVTSGRFAQFDYGSKLNKKYYNSLAPPDYNVSSIKLPSYLIYSVNDWLGTEKGTFILYNKLTSQKKMKKLKNKQFNHMDFFFARDVVNVVIDELIAVLEIYKS